MVPFMVRPFLTQEVDRIATVPWSKFPQVRGHLWGRKWLEYLALLDYAENIISAYGLDLALFLDFSIAAGNFDPVAAKRTDIMAFLAFQRGRPNLMPGASETAVLGNASLRRSLAAVTSFYDFLIDSEVRSDNPVARRRTSAGGYRKALVLAPESFPRIPDELEWRKMLDAAVEWRVRDRLMLLLAYDGALRCDELTNLNLSFLTLHITPLRYQLISLRDAADCVRICV
jgi:site-specific recombinase XerD